MLHVRAYRGFGDSVLASCTTVCSDLRKKEKGKREKGKGKGKREKKSNAQCWAMRTYGVTIRLKTARRVRVSMRATGQLQ